MSARPNPATPAPAHAILLAVTGDSPAILTETVWALAHEAVPALPKRIIVLTTSAGAERLRTDLLSASDQFGGRSPWQALREELLKGVQQPEHFLVMEEPRIISASAGADGVARTLADLRSPADNTAAADFILEQVRAVAANPETQLIASMAGGRKTMGALLYAAMTLVGRETDRLTHVLVNAPFDQRLTPPFYFPPRKRVRHIHQGREGKGQTVLSSSAKIELADVPFVPLRNAFEELRAPVGGFAGLVARYGKELRSLSRPPSIDLDPGSCSVLVDGVCVRLENPAELGVIHALLILQPELAREKIDFASFAEVARAWLGGKPQLTGNDQKKAAALARRIARTLPPEEIPAWVSTFDVRTVTRALSILRTTLKTACPRWRIQSRTLLLPAFSANGILRSNTI